MKHICFLFCIFILLASCSPVQPTGEPTGGVVYINNTDLLIMESYPVQISLHVTGDLPTPCHFFNYSYQIGSANDRFRIEVSAWSKSDPGAVCAQVLEPFEINIPIPMEDAAEGSYSVWLNGEKVGEFSYPA